jgi:hypothetical protein
LHEHGLDELGFHHAPPSPRTAAMSSSPGPTVAAPVAAEPDVIKQYEDAGADGIVVFVTPAAEQEMLAELEQIARKIIG